MTPSIMTPAAAIMKRHEQLYKQTYDVANAAVLLSKSASAPALAHALAGRLVVSSSGWGLLEVPKALVQGAFDALHEPGVEMPPGRNGQPYKAHITVFNPADIEQIGGADKLTERGHYFKYTLGPVRVVDPDGWSEMSKAWFIEVSSPELEKLRKSYGLTALPKEGKHKFHITLGVRRKHVLKENDVAKAAAHDPTANLPQGCQVKSSQGQGGVLDNQGPGWDIRPSSIDGLGLFASRDYQPGDVVVPRALDKHAGLLTRYEETDAARYTNHAADANLVLVKKGNVVSLVANRAIPAGTEMTVNYRTVDPVLGPGYYLSYKGKPYFGASTSGGDVSWIKEALAMPSFGPEEMETIKAIALNPLIQTWAQKHGLIYSPGEGNVADRMDRMRQQAETFKTTTQVAPEDKPTYVRFLTGLANVMGAKASGNQQLQTVINRAAEDVGTIAPYIRTFAPNFWESMHGWRGSAANLAGKVYQANQATRDPYTGQRGVGPEQSAQQAKGIFNRLYGPNQTAAATSGLSASKLGDLYGTMQEKGLMGSQTPLTPEQQADRLSEMSKPTVAVQDLMSQVQPPSPPTSMFELPKLAADALTTPTKFAKARRKVVHGAVAGIRHHGDRTVNICPYCDRTLNAADIYTDKKGWTFCRRCLRAGKGSIRLKSIKRASYPPGGLLPPPPRALAGGIPGVQRGEEAVQAPGFSKRAETSKNEHKPTSEPLMACKPRGQRYFGAHLPSLLKDASSMPVSKVATKVATFETPRALEVLKKLRPMQPIRNLLKRASDGGGWVRLGNSFGEPRALKEGYELGSVRVTSGELPPLLKRAISDAENMNLLEQLTHGQFANMDPAEVALKIRQMQSLGQTTPGGIQRVMNLVGAGGDLAESLGLQRQFATHTAPGTAAFGGAWKGLAGRQGFGGLTMDEAMALDQRLRMNASASPVANLMAATVALYEAGSLRPGTPGAEMAESILKKSPVTPSGIDIGRIQPTAWSELMQQSGVSGGAAWDQLRAMESNQEITAKHSIGDMVRHIQGELELKPMLQSTLGQGMGGTLQSAGIVDEEQQMVSPQLAATMTDLLQKIPQEQLLGPRAGLVKGLSQQLIAAHPQMAGRLNPEQWHELVNSSLTNLDQVVRTDNRYKTYRNTMGLLAAHRPDIMRAATAAQGDARFEGATRGSLAHVGKQNWIQRLSDTVAESTPETTLTENLARGFGAVPAAQVRQGVAGIDPKSGLNNLLPTTQQADIGKARQERQEQMQMAPTTPLTPLTVKRSAVTVAGRPLSPTVPALIAGAPFAGAGLGAAGGAIFGDEGNRAENAKRWAMIGGGAGLGVGAGGLLGALGIGTATTVPAIMRLIKKMPHDISNKDAIKAFKGDTKLMEMAERHGRLGGNIGMLPGALASGLGTYELTKESAAEKEAPVKIDVPKLEQSTGHTCGPATAATVLKAHDKPGREKELAKEVKANPEEGTQPEDLVKLFTRRGLKAHKKEDMSLQELQNSIDAGRPVVMDVQAWGDDDHDNDDAGHYVTMIGYDAHNVYFQDPGLGKPKRTYLSVRELQQRWHDKNKGKKTRRLGIVVWDPDKDTKPDEGGIKKVEPAEKMGATIRVDGLDIYFDEPDLAEFDLATLRS